MSEKSHIVALRITALLQCNHKASRTVPNGTVPKNKEAIRRIFLFIRTSAAIPTIIMEPTSPIYQTKFFDVITLPPLPPLPPPQTNEKQGTLQNFNSIMCYEDAIVDAITELKDSHNGSTVSAIKKHIQAHFFHENYPGLNEEEAEMLSLDPAPSMRWKDTLFVQALKSVVEKKCVTHSICTKNGSTLYKLSHDYKKQRAEELNDRLERLEKYKIYEREKKQMLSDRKEVPVHTPVLKKGHLVENKVVDIIGNVRKSHMDLDLEKQNDKRSALPHTLGLHADDSLEKKKGLREKLKIPHSKILVKEM